MGESGPTFSGAITVAMAIPAGLQIGYSDFAAVQSTDYAVVLSFYQLQPPGLETPEAVAAFKANPVVPANCVSRFALPRVTAGRLLEELQRHLRAGQSQQAIKETT